MQLLQATAMRRLVLGEREALSEFLEVAFICAAGWRGGGSRRALGVGGRAIRTALPTDTLIVGEVTMGNEEATIFIVVLVSDVFLFFVLEGEREW